MQTTKTKVTTLQDLEKNTSPQPANNEELLNTMMNALNREHTNNNISSLNRETVSNSSLNNNQGNPVSSTSSTTSISSTTATSSISLTPPVNEEVQNPEVLTQYQQRPRTRVALSAYHRNRQNANNTSETINLPPRPRNAFDAAADSASTYSTGLRAINDERRRSNIRLQMIHDRFFDLINLSRRITWEYVNFI